MASRVVFCTTCKNRTQHLKVTLPQNLVDNSHAVFVVLNYNTDDDLIEYIDGEYRALIDEGRLVLYSHLDTPKFRMAHAKNMAHRLGIREGGDILVNVDADNFAGAGFDEYIRRQFARYGSGIFMSARMIKGVMVRGINGRIAVTKEAFLRSGGYDEVKFNGGWSSEDKDFNLRLRQLGYQDVEIAPFYLNGVPHNDKVRFREYPHMAAIAGDLEITPQTVTKVANNGAFGCGTVFRNHDLDSPIIIEPLSRRPRVFGIGMHKTATTSLHIALQKLGYESWHWSSAHVAKAIWREMNEGDRSPTMEQYDALCDLPIPLLYRKLDEAYPGSKFILTLRDERKWLEAVMRHFSVAFNKWRAGWDNDPFTNIVHQKLYKRTDFEPDVFLERYQRHNAEVLEFFKNRSQDLLVMKMDQGAGWKELCGFLGHEAPADINYPFVNGTA